MTTRNVIKTVLNSSSEALLEQLNEFRKNEQFTDVVLVCNETRIPAHRNVLAAASPYFMAMFSGNFPECNQSEVLLHDIDTHCLELAIEFIYTGSAGCSGAQQLGITDESVQQLLVTASFLQLEHLTDLCAEYITERLDAENCLGFKHFAEKQNNFMLLQSAKNFIITHFKDVVQCDEFFEMSYTELASILSNDELYVHSDDTVLCGLIHWAEHNKQENLPHLPELLRYIHPACVKADALTAREHAVLTCNDKSSEWLSEVLNCEGKVDWCIFLLDKMGRQPDLQRFDLQFENSVQLKPLPSPAFAVSLVAYKNILYVQGGSTGRSKRDSFYYNIYRNQWYELRPLIMERSHHRSLVVDECLYALGGNCLQAASSSVECLNLVTNQATFRDNMLAKRSSLGAAMCENVLYVMGGETDNRSLHSMERYDPRIGHWQDMPSMREVNSYCSSAFVAPYYIYCCEGLGSCMERFDLRANKWDIIDFWEQREFYEIFTVDNDLLSISGEEISAYNPNSNRWNTKYKFPESREWDTAVGMQMMINYASI